MFLSFLLALSIAEEEGLGTYSSSGSFLPMVNKEVIDGRGLFLENPNNRIPIKPLTRFVSTFVVHGNEAFGLQKVFGHITSADDSNDFVFNFSTIGLGGRLSNEDVPTFTHYAQLESQFEPGVYGVDVWAKVTDEHGVNRSVLVYNQTVEFYEVTNIKEQFGTAFLYLFFVGVVGGILYMIFSKDTRTTATSQKPKKTQVRDYADVHGVERTPSPSPSGSSGRSKSPAKKE